MGKVMVRKEMTGPGRKLKACAACLTALLAACLFLVTSTVAAQEEPDASLEVAPAYTGAAFGTVSGIFYDRVSGFVYTADSRENRIACSLMDGTGWVTLGSEGSRAGCFRQPGGLYYDVTTGYVYVADTGNHRVVKTRMDGSGWEVLGSEGHGDSQFYYPGDIWFDPIGEYLFIADTGNDRVVKTRMDGSGWEVLGTTGSDKFQFVQPSGISYHNGYLYVADTGNDRVVRCAINGMGWTTLDDLDSGASGLKSPRDVYYDDISRLVYVADTGNHRVVETRIYGGSWAAWGGYGTGIGEMAEPSGISFDYSTGQVYVADTGNHRVVAGCMDGNEWRGLGIAADPLTWYFTGGTTRDGRQTVLSLSNTGESSATAAVTFVTATGSEIAEEFSLIGKSLTSIDVNPVVGDGEDFSIHVQSDQLVVAECSTYYKSPDGTSGGYALPGRTSLDTVHFFPEGSTRDGFRTSFTLWNPGRTVASVEIACFFPDIDPFRQELELAPGSQRALDLKSLVGGERDVSVTIKSDMPVMAARTVSFDYRGWVSGENVTAGTGEPATRLYLTSGTTRAGSDEYIRVFNPGGWETAVRFRFYFPDGTTSEREATVGAGRNYTLDLRDAVGEERDMAVEIVSGQPVTAERTAYFDHLGFFKGGHIVPAVAGPATFTCFAEGTTGLGSEQWIDLFNPGDEAAEVFLTYILPEGDPGHHLVTIEPHSRLSIPINDSAPFGTGLSTLVESSRPIVAERSIFFLHNLETSGGSAATGFSR